MKKIKFAVVFIISCMFLKVGVVKASDDGFYQVKDEASFDECITKLNACKLTADINVTTPKVIQDNMILDLNGYSIMADSTLNLHSGLIVLKRGSKLTINDDKNTGKITTGKSGNVWASIQLLNDNKSEEIAELIVNGGTIEGYYYGIVGNGTLHHTKITINNGTIKGLNENDSVGIFQPQMGELIINNGTILGGTGIEIRSGILTVNNGTIKGIAPKFIKVINRSGSTTNGVGIAVAQHTTKNEIKVTINDGNISGEYAFYEWNPHNNSEADIKKISMHIYGGNFTGTANNVKAIYSENFTKFISGGKFNTNIDEYLTDDAQTTLNEMENKNKLITKETDNHVFIILAIILITFSIGGIILYRSKIKHKFY